MSINYRNKNDIPYFKFLEFSNNIDSQPPAFVLSETIRIFNPIDVELFSKALETSAPFRPRFKIDISYKKVSLISRLWNKFLRQPKNETAGDFIDADTFFSDKEYLNFFKSVLKRKYFFKNVNFENISLSEAEYIIGSFSELKNKLREEYEYLYNPPIRGVGKEMSPGGLEREAFAEHYGSYIEMIYVLCKGDFTKFEEVTKWGLDRFLFQAEYLIRKRDIENLK